MPSHPTSTLPLPAPEAAEHSARLVEFIRRDIAAHGGWITFARYMELALYAPGLGYYATSTTLPCILLSSLRFRSSC